jgi:hypothetical protein
MRLIAVPALFFSVQAFACPNLAGIYTCTHDGSVETLTLNQSDKDGVTIYDYNGSSFPADNKAHLIPDDENLKAASARVWCDAADGTLLRTQVFGKYYVNNSYLGDLTLDVTRSLSGQNLKQVSRGMLKTPLDEYPVESESVCTRN